MEATISHPEVQKYREAQVKNDAEFKKLVLNPFLFKLFMLKSLPMGVLAGLKVKSLSVDTCEITVPYRWVNKNPFSSTYFAVLAMAAEMSSGLLSMMGTVKTNPSVATLVTGIEAEFVKKATDVTTFTCVEGHIIREAIEKAIVTGEGVTCKTESVGRSENGTIVARFWVTWSFKSRRK